MDVVGEEDELGEVMRCVKKASENVVKVENNGNKIGLGDDALVVLTKFISNYSQLILAKDCEAFARHANKVIITPRDILLVTRRSSNVSLQLNAYLETKSKQNDRNSIAKHKSVYHQKSDSD
uniref:Centromere protein S n=1 Tax=Timspurckia oligopyrenoides TaxID=708627 RepID=A0A7S0ZJ73_9RHOD|mmetsp:Transcript_7397/g.13352  ORF Transcript_7397/g.13352 Transcript_7397/m.13352 type:complete len:122 (+) Transcript_7397:45-410(+)